MQKLREGFLVKVNCEKGEDRLVRILVAFDEIGLNVQQARVSSNKRFEMEAIVVAHDQALDVKEVTEALLGALKRKLEMRHLRSLEADPVANEQSNLIVERAWYFISQVPSSNFLFCDVLS